MDTKSKKYNPIAAWLAFFLGINLLIGAVLGLFILRGNIESILSKDYKQMDSFKYAMNIQFDDIINNLAEREMTFGQDYNNTLYFGSYNNGNTNQSVKTKTNSDLNDYESAVNYLRSKASEFDYLMFWDGSKLSVFKNDQPVTLGNDDIYLQQINKYRKTSISEWEKYRVAIGVKSKLTEKSGSIYYAYVEWIKIKAAAAAVIIMFLVSVILLVISLIRRSGIMEFSARLADLLKNIWLEIKIIITFLVLFVSVSSYNHIFEIIYAGIVIWWGYLMLADLYYNKSHFFFNNLITWIIRQYRIYEKRKPFQKAMMMRLIALTSAEAVMIFFTILSLASYGEGKFFSLVFVIAGVYIYYKYIKAYEIEVTDIGRIADQIELIRGGNFNTKLKLKEESDLYTAAESLNHIQEGVQATAIEQLKSERMKVELITNVSHDLKTPLTSIVNYIDLLSKENLSPDFANDYVKTLAKKVSRLTSLTQDLFDISKAQSGNLELNIEKLNVVELVKQSIAEMDERIKESGLNFKVSLPEHKVYINADGRKLYRVFENLVSNVLKYSLQNTRVYIDMIEDDSRVHITFKNIANYEMNIDSKEILERFVRGDESRSTEGSGLGLAIVQSFVSLCGGEFRIDVDGDLFKAVVSFKKSEQY